MRLLSVIVVLACLALADCADRDSRSDGNRFGGFYGGVHGGVVP